MRFKECHYTKVVLNLSWDCISHLNPHIYNCLEIKFGCISHLNPQTIGLNQVWLQSQTIVLNQVWLHVSFESPNNCLESSLVAFLIWIPKQLSWIKFGLHLPFLSSNQLSWIKFGCISHLIPQTIVLNQVWIASPISILRPVVLNQAQTSSLISILKQLSLNQAQIAAPHFNSPNCLESSSDCISHFYPQNTWSWIKLRCHLSFQSSKHLSWIKLRFHLSLQSSKQMAWIRARSCVAGNSNSGDRV